MFTPTGEERKTCPPSAAQREKEARTPRPAGWRRDTKDLPTSRSPIPGLPAVNFPDHRSQLWLGFWFLQAKKNLTEENLFIGCCAGSKRTGVWPVPSASELCSNLVDLFGISFPMTLLTRVSKALCETLEQLENKHSHCGPKWSYNFPHGSHVVGNVD